MHAYTPHHHPESLYVGQEVLLSEDAVNHVGRVLRIGASQAIQLFDGSNQVFDAEIVQADKRSGCVKVLSGSADDRESPLGLHLGQVMSRGEKWNLPFRRLGNWA